MASLELYFWGTPRIIRDGSLLAFDTRKATALIAYLAFHPEGLSRDTLSAFLWPDFDQEHARAALRRTLSTLHTTLDTGSASWLEIERERINLRRTTAYWMDVDRFHQLITGRSAHGHPSNQVCPKCLSDLREAVALQKGSFLAGFSLRDSPDFDDWQSLQNESLNVELGEALQMLARGCGGLGDFENAIAYARKWLALDPLREEAHRELMRLYSWAGQRPAAIKQYRECVAVLDRELGVPPLDETTQLHQLIVEDRLPGLDVEAEKSAALPSQPAIIIGAAQGKAEPYPLVGRKTEMDQLSQAYSQVGDEGYLAVLEGEPGIGKTRLACEFLEHARLQGTRIVASRCYEGQASLSYAPIIEGLRTEINTEAADERLRNVPKNWLVEASRLLPELHSLVPDLPSAAPLDGPGAQSLFFEGLRQLILALCRGPQPGILFLDDMHWVDTATLDFLAFITRRLSEFPLLVLFSWREEHTQLQQALHNLLAETQRSGHGRMVRLGRLTPADIEALLQKAPEIRDDKRKTLGSRLYAEAEGLPLFVIEYLAVARETGMEVDQNWNIPSTIRELILSRLAGVDATSRQLLSTAAAIGRVFDFDILQQASGRSEIEVIGGLENLIAHRIIQEKPSEDAENPAYDFVHEKIREIIYEDSTIIRRRLLHRRIGEAILNRWRREIGPHAGQVAYHFQLAGENSRAAEYYQKAGEHAVSLYANSQALVHFQAAVDLGHPDRAGLFEAIGDLYTLQGEYPKAIRYYMDAIEQCDPTCRCELERKLGNVYDRWGDWNLADSYYQSAYAGLSEAGLQAPLTRLQADRSRLAYHRGDLRRAKELAEETRRLAAESGDSYALAQAYNLLGMVARSQGDYDQAGQYLEMSLAQAEGFSDPKIRIAALNNLALVYRDNQHLTRAIEVSLSALDLCAQVGDRHRQAALHNNLADLYYATGQPEDAMEQLKKAVVIFSKIGSESGNLSAEPWKLVEW